MFEKLRSVSVVLLALTPTTTPTAVGYVANAKDNTITSFLLDESTGALANASTAPTGSFPVWPTITPDRRFLFVSNYWSGTISTYSIDRDGEMRSSGAPIHLLGSNASPSQIAITGSGTFLYVGNGTTGIEAFRVDSQTGNLSPITGSPFSATTTGDRVLFTHSGKFLYADGNSDAIDMFQVDSDTGSLAPIPGTVHTGVVNCAMVVDPADRFLFVNACEVGKLLVFEIQSNGSLQEIGNTRIISGQYSSTLAISPNGRWIYMDDAWVRGDSNLVDNGILGYSFEVSSKSLTPMSGSPFLDNQSPTSVAVSPSGTILVVSRLNPGHVASYRIDPQTGALTPISGTLSTSGVPTGYNPLTVVLVPR